MNLDERVCMPRDGHEMTCIDLASGSYWCVRCGALWLESHQGVRARSWMAPNPSGRTHSTQEAPPCVASTDVGASNTAGDARLMLLALTRGWRCEPVMLPDAHNTQAWRWSHNGPLGGESWAVPGIWDDGPVITEPLRRLMLSTIG